MRLDRATYGHPVTTIMWAESGLGAGEAGDIRRIERTATLHRVGSIAETAIAIILADGSTAIISITSATRITQKELAMI